VFGKSFDDQFNANAVDIAGCNANAWFEGSGLHNLVAKIIRGNRKKLVHFTVFASHEGSILPASNKRPNNSNQS
jgi:hypothetical protein